MKPSAEGSARVSAILQLKDGFSGGPIVTGTATFQLDSAPYEALRKASGFYVFADLSILPHEVHISCAGFLSIGVALTAISLPLVKPLAELITVCELEPSSSYSYPVGTTLVCGQVTSAEGPLADVEVFALFSDRAGAWHWRKTMSSGSVRDNDQLRGHYALAVPPIAAGSQVNLRFMKDGHVSHFDRVIPTRSMTTIVGADLQPKIV